MSPVELETDRLKLRMWRESDLDAYAAMSADPMVMRYLGAGAVMTRAEAWRSMAFFIGHWQMRGYGHWAVEEKATGRMIGRIGFLNPEGWPGFEIGWTLARDAWGKGYATEGCEDGARVRVHGARPASRHQFDSPGERSVHEGRRTPR